MRMWIVLGICLSVAAPGAAGPLQVKLEVIPPVTLPGIPVTIRVTYRNDRPSRPVEIPRAMMLAARSTGEQFPVPAGGAGYVVPTDVQKTVGRVPVVDEISPDGTFGVPPWFFSTALARPGTYELQLYVGNLSQCCVERPFPELVQKASAVSNAVTLTVAEPQGVDAVVWKTLREMAGTADDWLANEIRGPDGSAVALRLLREYPESTYAGWILSTVGSALDPEEDAKMLRAWLAKHADDPFFEQRMLAVAESETFLAHKYGATQPEESKLHEAHARADLARLANAKSKAVRERVIDRLQWLDELHQE